SGDEEGDASQNGRRSARPAPSEPDQCDSAQRAVEMRRDARILRRGGDVDGQYVLPEAQVHAMGCVEAEGRGGLIAGPRARFSKILLLYRKIQLRRVKAYCTDQDYVTA